MNVDAVILDMDGLMLDTEPLYKDAWQKAASHLGFPLDDSFYFTLVGRTNAAGESALTERFGSDFSMTSFRERWERLWREQVEASGIPLKPGLVELLEYLAARNVPLAVATSSDLEYAALSLKAARLDARRFADIVTGEQVQHGKPAPDIYLEAARRLGVSPARSLAIEDSDAGILSASGAGMISVMVPDLKPPSPEARRAAFRVLASLNDVVALLSADQHHARQHGQCARRSSRAQPFVQNEFGEHVSPARNSPMTPGTAKLKRLGLHQRHKREERHRVAGDAQDQQAALRDDVQQSSEAARAHRLLAGALHFVALQQVAQHGGDTPWRPPVAHLICGPPRMSGVARRRSQPARRRQRSAASPASAGA